MVRLSWIVLAGFVSLLVPVLGGWTDSWKAIRAASSQTSSIEADFVQTKRLPILKHPIVSRGRLVYRKPGQIRWEYQSPVKMILLLDAQGVRRFTWRDGKWVPDASGRLLAVQSVLREMNLWMAGEFEKSQVFAPQLLAAPPRVRLVPKEAGLRKLISSVEVMLGSTPGVVDAIEITEGPKASLRIDFSGIKLNQPISDRVFESPK
jgi:outer membrane lipoprotein carrier protein